MKKYFKTPDEAKKSDPKAVAKILKKVFDKGVGGTKFFYKAQFNYLNGEIAPFVYIGAPAGPWKIFIKNSKRDKDFAAGLCSLGQNEAGDTELKLLAQMGKGDKGLFLKEINKQLLRKINVKAVFVDELPITEMVDEDDEDDDEASTDSPEILEDSVPEVPEYNPQELANLAKEIIADFKLVRTSHNPGLLGDLLGKIDDWNESYTASDEGVQKALVGHLGKVDEVSKILRSINQVNDLIDSLLSKIMPLIKEFAGMPLHGTPQAVALKEKIDRNISKLEIMATKIKDLDLISECKYFREAIEE
jgi:hypothetical protein